MRRRILKLTILVTGLLLVLGLVAYWLLLAFVPARWILDSVSAELGLDVTAQSLSIGWTGHTQLHQVRVVLPANDEELLSATDIQLTHRAPLWLLVTGSVDLRNVMIESPSLHARADVNGRWNLQDAWTRVNAGREAIQTSNDRIGLPRVEVRNASVVVTDANGTTETLGPLSFEGSPKDRSLWSFALKAKPGIEAEGQTAQGHDWSHTIGFRIEEIAPLLTAIAKSDLGDIDVAGRWEGRLDGETVVGQLNLDRMRVGDVTIQGKVDVSARPKGVTLRPVSLLMTEPNLVGESIRIATGSIHLETDQITVEQVGLQAGEISASLDGHWADATRLGDATISWMARQAKGESEGQGTCQITWHWPAFGRREAEVKLSATAQTSAGNGSVMARILGAGRTWQDSDWEVSVPKLAWRHDDRDFEMTGLDARLTLNASDLRLTSLQWPNAEKLNAQAQLDTGTGKWSAEIDGRGLQLAPLTDQPVDIRFDGAGDSSKLAISELNVTQGRRTLVAKGELSISDRSLAGIHVTAQWPAPSRAPAPATTTVPNGQWRCETDITGRLDPMALKIQGVLGGTNVPLGKRVVTEVNIPVQADLDTKRVAITTEPFALLEGQWRISGRHEWSNTLTQLSLATNDLSLKAAAAMAGSPVTCRGRVKAELQLAAPGLRLQDAVAVGGWSAEAIEVPPFQAQNARGKVQIANGQVRFDDIYLDHQEGQAQGRLQFRLDRPQHLSLGFDLTRWPILLDDGSLILRVSGTAETQLDVVAKTMQGQGRLSGDITWQDKAFGRLILTNSVAGRTLAIEELRIETLGGVIAGQARIPLDKWTQGTGQLAWHDIEPQALKPWWPGAETFQGRLSGSLVAAQADEANRPPEPILLEVYSEMTDGRIGAGHIENGRIIAYLGPRRLLVNQATFDLLGGQVKGRACISPHAGKFYATVVTDINNIDLDQLVHAVHPKANPTPGRLAGAANLLLASDFSSFSGRANLDISQSDLTGNSVVGTLYETMRLSLGSTELEGTGQMQIQLSGPRVNIPSFVYFNRGVEIRGVGQIDDIWRGQASPVRGYAFGSTRILKGLSLPGVRELDRVVSSLQSNAASVKIAGQLEAPKIEVVPLPAVTGALRRLLWAQLRGDTYETSEAPSN